MNDDRGESLLETLMTIMLLGIVVTAVMGAAIVGIKSSKLHDNQSSASNDLRNWAESLSASTTYVNCATSASFSVPSLSNGTGSVVSVEYWNGSSFTSTCTTDQGTQKLTLQVVTLGESNVNISKQLEVVVRRP